MHVDQVEGILALFLICLRQIATSKKLLNRLSGFLDDIHDVLLFTMDKSLRQNSRSRPSKVPRAILNGYTSVGAGKKGATWMSAIGPKQTLILAPHMSTLGGKADMTIALRNVDGKCFYGGSILPLEFGPMRSGNPSQPLIFY